MVALVLRDVAQSPVFDPASAANAVAASLRVAADKTAAAMPVAASSVPSDSAVLPAALHRHSKKHDSRCSASAIADGARSNCCSKRCMDGVRGHYTSLASLEKVIRLDRERYWEKDEAGRTNWLLELIDILGGVNDHNVELKYHGAPVCRVALCNLFGFSDKKLRKAIELAEKGATAAPPHGNTGQTHDALAQICRAWMAEKFALICEQKSDAEWLLPCHLSRYEAYEFFLADRRDLPCIETRTDPSFATFQAVWHKYFGFVHQPKQSQLPKCGDCMSLDTATTAAADPAERHAVRSHRLSWLSVPPWR